MSKKRVEASELIRDNLFLDFEKSKELSQILNEIDSLLTTVSIIERDGVECLN